MTQSINPANDEQARYKAQALSVPTVPAAQLVSALAGPGGQHITGQLLGVRGREIFLFSQARPIDRLVVGPEEDMAGRIQKAFGPKLTGLSTDLEAFASDPIV